MHARQRSQPPPTLPTHRHRSVNAVRSTVSTSFVHPSPLLSSMSFFVLALPWVVCRYTIYGPGSYFTSTHPSIHCLRPLSRGGYVDSSIKSYLLCTYICNTQPHPTPFSNAIHSNSIQSNVLQIPEQSNIQSLPPLLRCKYASLLRVETCQIACFHFNFCFVFYSHFLPSPHIDTAIARLLLLPPSCESQSIYETQTTNHKIYNKNLQLLNSL